MSLPEQVYTVSDPTASLSQCLSDLESLRDLLTDLPSRLHHEVMVPISPVGFLVGKIKHSNEVGTRQVLVHLGAEWYVKRTCAQAAEIVERRIQATKPRELVLEGGGEVRTKEEALARLQRLAEEEEKSDAMPANIKEKTPEPVSEIREKATFPPPTAESPDPQPKKLSKFMRDRHPAP